VTEEAWKAFSLPLYNRTHAVKPTCKLTHRVFQDSTLRMRIVSTFNLLPVYQHTSQTPVYELIAVME